MALSSAAVEQILCGLCRAFLTIDGDHKVNYYFHYIALQMQDIFLQLHLL